MGQDSEQAAEYVMTVRTDHVPMKTWYNGTSAAAQGLQKTYGPYPDLWKEVLNWPGWKEARREYLKHTQQQPEPATGSAPTPVPRKRKSRWGTTSNNDDNNNDDDDANKRQSRWARDAPLAPVPQHNPYGPATGHLPVLPTPSAANIPPHKQDEHRNLQARLRQVNEKMEHLEREAARVDALPRGHRERSPSPPPVYGADGKRRNTRAVRWRERYTAERQDLLEQIMNLNPATRQNNLFVRKRTKKIRIPIEKHPTYNFIGLIIGPRGKTQKELESKTGCKIAIRGRGSVKDGARGRRDGKIMEGDNEPLHVVITGDDQRAVDAASEMIDQMLVVIDDEKNVHKQQQLRELALLNGTLKDEEFCQICAEKGHRSFECPRRFSVNKPTLTVKCAICGDTSHPTRDCRQKVAPPTDQKNAQEIDTEYLSFMAELDGPKPTSAAEAANGGPPNPPGGASPAFVLPPPPPAAVSNLPPPPPSGNLPPPPTGGSNLPPPPGVPAYPGQQHQQQQHPSGPYGTYGGQQPHHHHQQQQQQGYHNNGYGAPQQQGYQAEQAHHQQQQQPPGAPQSQQPPVRPGEETTGWDPSSYYGQGAGGAGGFNWWEQ